MKRVKMSNKERLSEVGYEESKGRISPFHPRRKRRGERGKEGREKMRGKGGGVVEGSRRVNLHGYRR